VSGISQATVEQLQAASTNYPAWITERYLQLPDSTTERTRQLAQQLTAQYDDAFSKADAVERYLRSEITYNEQIAAPPIGVDKVDYILFEAKEAYCDYYASSMIVMLRSMGIPARLAVGFAQGDSDRDQNIFHVVNADAHSWVEVYFPAYGWIEFEPTAAQPVVIRHSGQDDEFIPGADRLEDADLSAEGDLPDGQVAFQIALPLLGTISVSRGVAASIIAALLNLAIGGWTFYARRQQSLENAPPMVSAVYFSLLKLASWMGLKKRPEQTAYEHASQLEAVLPRVKPEVDLITDEFVRQQYSQDYAISNSIKNQIIEAWNNARPLLYRAAIERRNPLRKIFHKK